MNKLTDDFFDMLEYFEGLMLYPYLCSSGVPTIGYGSTFYEDGTKVTLQDKPITIERAKKIKEHALEKFMNEMEIFLDREATDYEYCAMLSLLYNIGGYQFATSSVLKYFNKRDKQKAADSFKMWRLSRGKVMIGLVRRRSAECLMFKGLSWTNFKR